MITNFPADAGVKENARHEYLDRIPKIDSFALVFNVGQMRTFIEVGKNLERKMDVSLEKQDEMLGKQEMIKKQDEQIDITKEILHETKHISARQEEQAETAGEFVEKLNSISRADKEIKRHREEFQQLKGAIRKAGI